MLLDRRLALVGEKQFEDIVGFEAENLWAGGSVI